MGAISILIQLLVSVVLYFMAWRVFLLIIIVNEIVRLIVSIILYLKYDGKVVLVGDGLDGIWATQNDQRTRIIVLGSRYKGPLKEETFQKVYKEKIRCDKDESGNFYNEKLEKILTTRMGYACWEEDSTFDIRNHVRFLSDEVFDKPKLQKLIQEISQEMPPTKPQWEWIVVPSYVDGKDKNESGWVFCRCNHAYADGLSTILSMKRYLFPHFNFFIDPLTFHVPLWIKLLFYLNAILFWPYTAITFYINKSKEFWPRRECKSPKMNFRWTKSINFGTIKAIRKAAGNTTQSALVENAFISAMIQVLPSSRIPDEIVIGEIAALVPYPDEKLRNRFSIFHYPISSVDSEWKRLKETKKAAWNAMIGPQILCFYYGFKMMGRMPTIFHHHLLDGSGATLIFSNMPLSKTKVVGVDDIEGLEFIGFPPQRNDTGIILCCTTYIDSVKITASAKTDWLSEDELEAIINRVPEIIEDWAKSAKKIEEEQKSKIL